MLNYNNSIVNQCIINASHDANTLIGYKLSFFKSQFGYNLYDLSFSHCLRCSSPVHLTADKIYHIVYTINYRLHTYFMFDTLKSGVSN